MTPLIYRYILGMTVINGRLIERLASKLPPSQTVYPAVIQEAGNIINLQSNVKQSFIRHFSNSLLQSKLSNYVFPFFNLYQLTYFDYDNYKFHNNMQLGLLSKNIYIYNSSSMGFHRFANSGFVFKKNTIFASQKCLDID